MLGAGAAVCEQPATSAASIIAVKALSGFLILVVSFIFLSSVLDKLIIVTIATMLKALMLSEHADVQPLRRIPYRRTMWLIRGLEASSKGNGC